MNDSLHEFDKVEWFDVCRKFKPSLTWEEYEVMWERAMATYAESAAKRRLQ